MLRTGRESVTVLVVALASLLPILAIYTTATPSEELESSPLPTATVSHTLPEFDPGAVSNDVLWLARCIHSETKKQDEQELVAWVIRNRVETGYRGQSTYEGTVLDPFQFSAFNAGSPKRQRYMTLTPQSNSASFMRALEVAHEVYHAPASERPFPETTRHFYSERSMVGGKTPRWAEGQSPVRPVRHRIDPRRFRFYSGLATVTL